MNWNKAVLVFFLSPKENLKKVEAVLTQWPTQWRWDQLICVVPDNDIRHVCRLTDRVKLSDLRPQPDTYYVIIADDAAPDMLGSVLLRIMRAGCACRSYVRQGDKLKELE